MIEKNVLNEKEVIEVLNEILDYRKNLSIDKDDEKAVIEKVKDLMQENKCVEVVMNKNLCSLTKDSVNKLIKDSVDFRQEKRFRDFLDWVNPDYVMDFKYFNEDVYELMLANYNNTLAKRLRFAKTEKDKNMIMKEFKLRVQYLDNLKNLYEYNIIENSSRINEVKSELSKINAVKEINNFSR